MRIRPVTILVLALFVALAIPEAALARKTIGLSSGTFKFEADAGKTVDGKVIVSNDGDEDLNVLVYAADQHVDESGRIRYDVPSRADISTFDKPSSWVRLKLPQDIRSLGNVPYVTLKPGERIPVEFSLEVPTGVAAGDHNVLLFFEVFESPSATEGARSLVSGRLGSRVTLRVKGEIVERLELRPFDVPRFVVGGTVPYRFRVRNQGNVDRRVTATTVLLDRGGNEIAKGRAIDGRLVFANANLETSGTLTPQRQPFGNYKVRVDVVPVDDDGNPIASGKDTITQELTTWVVPLWLVVAIAVFIVLLLGRILWMLIERRRKRSVSEALEAERKAPQAQLDPNEYHVVDHYETPPGAAEHATTKLRDSEIPPAYRPPDHPNAPADSE